jgi:hypothetical protein
LALAVGSGDVVTLWALLAGVLGINHPHRNTGHLRLVPDQLSKLKEAPIRVSCALRASGLNPLPNAPEVFQSNQGRGALRGLHDAFRYAVVGVFLKPCLGSCPILVIRGS